MYGKDKRGSQSHSGPPSSQKPTSKGPSKQQERHQPDSNQDLTGNDVQAITAVSYIAILSCVLGKRSLLHVHVHAYGAGAHQKSEESDVTGSSETKLTRVSQCTLMKRKIVVSTLTSTNAGSFGHPEHSVTTSGHFLWNSNA